MSEIENAPRINPPNPQWEQNLPSANSPASGKADSWDELNHLDAAYLEFSMASNIVRGLMLVTGMIPLGFGLFLLVELVFDYIAGNGDGFLPLAILLSAFLLLVSIFVIRFDLRLPKITITPFSLSKK